MQGPLPRASAPRPWSSTLDETKAFLAHAARQLRAMARLMRRRAGRLDKEALDLERIAGTDARAAAAARDREIIASPATGAALAAQFRLSKGRVSQIRKAARDAGDRRLDAARPLDAADRQITR